jgi:hypothetical protein
MHEREGRVSEDAFRHSRIVVESGWRRVLPHCPAQRPKDREQLRQKRWARGSENRRSSGRRWH